MRPLHLVLIAGLVVVENTHPLCGLYRDSTIARNVLNIVMFALAYRMIFMEGPRVGDSNRDGASALRS